MSLCPLNLIKKVLSECMFITMQDLKTLTSVKAWKWHPTPVLLPGKPHGQRSLVGCSL